MRDFAPVIAVGGAAFIAGLILLCLCVGGIGIPYIALMWGGLFGKAIYISWWLGAGIQVASAMLISRKTMWIILSLVVITWLCEQGGVFG